MNLRRSRDVWLAVLLMLALAVVMYIATARQEADSPALPPLAARSTQPDGARAFLLWLERLEYAVDSAPKRAFTLPEAGGILILLEPARPVSFELWEELDAWVQAGGTIIIAGESVWTWAWAGHFDITMGSAPNAPRASLTKVQTPLWDAPPQQEFPGYTQPRTALGVGRDDVVVHATSGGSPTVVAFSQGNGRVVLTSIVHPFTNAGLQEPGNPEFVLNVLALAGPVAPVLYDEWHRGIRAVSSGGRGFGAWLRTSTAGRALLLAGFIIFVAVVLNGRSFGRPLMLPEQRMRRTPLEYVTAMANLQRRAHHRHALLMDYHMRLKRAYARRYHITASLPDDEFAARVADADPAVDAAELGGLLTALANPHVGEEEMVRLAATAVAWTENRPSHRKGTPYAD